MEGSTKKEVLTKEQAGQEIVTLRAKKRELQREVERLEAQHAADQKWIEEARESTLELTEVRRLAFKALRKGRAVGLLACLGRHNSLNARLLQDGWTQLLTNAFGPSYSSYRLRFGATPGQRQYSESQMRVFRQEQLLLLAENDRLLQKVTDLKRYLKDGAPYLEPEARVERKVEARAAPSRDARAPATVLLLTALCNSVTALERRLMTGAVRLMVLHATRSGHKRIVGALQTQLAQRHDSAQRGVVLGRMASSLATRVRLLQAAGFWVLWKHAEQVGTPARQKSHMFSYSEPFGVPAPQLSRSEVRTDGLALTHNDTNNLRHHVPPPAYFNQLPSMRQ